MKLVKKEICSNSLLEYLDIKVKKFARKLRNSDGFQFERDKYNDTFKDVSVVKFSRLPKSIREQYCYDSFLKMSKQHLA